MAKVLKSLGAGDTRLAIRSISIVLLTYGYVLPCAIHHAIEREARYEVSGCDALDGRGC